MTFLTHYQVEELKTKLVDDPSNLGKIYRGRKNKFQTLSVDHSLVEGYEKEGWEVNGIPLKTKTRLRKDKSHSKAFEDSVWCQFYELGYQCMNFDENFILPFSNKPEDKKQIDVVAIDGENILLIECKSSERYRKAPSYKDEFDLLGLRIDGFRKAMKQIFGAQFKVKYIFATNNLRIDQGSEDMTRLHKSKAFYYNNNTHDYVNNLIKNYKGAALYQFLGLVFKHELINSDKIEIPAVRGKMGNKTYYMFSLEPVLLLKMGFILHRTRANEAEFPTYQRLLVPSRLKGISKFIDEGGFFPNSIIVNFNTQKPKLQFESAGKKSGSTSCLGTLKIPNAYGIAYIIDGQHRVYGYANSKYKKSNTIPVVAFSGLSTMEQLEMFMDVNQNQKAVSPSLRLDLEEDLFWNADRVDSRLKALRSSIVKLLANSQNPLYRKISVGEDRALLTFKPFTTALSHSGLLPTAKGNAYNEHSTIASLYDVNNQNHQDEMEKAKNKIFTLLSFCYQLVEQDYEDVFNKEEYFIVSNRGTYAFICLIGDLNKFETESGYLNKSSSSEKRFETIKKYLITLLDQLKDLAPEDAEKHLIIRGASADTAWFRFFQTLINKTFSEYNPPELRDWQERQDEELQDRGRKLGVAIEKQMKALVLDKIQMLYGENWELEINSIKRACQDRAEQEMEKKYKEGLGKEDVLWTEMFNITDYKAIISKYWGKEPEIGTPDFATFEKSFSIDIGDGFHTKAEKLKWISYFNTHRNLWAHEGTKEKGLNRAEVAFLEQIHHHFYP